MYLVLSAPHNTEAAGDEGFTKISTMNIMLACIPLGFSALDVALTKTSCFGAFVIQIDMI